MRHFGLLILSITGALVASLACGPRGGFERFDYDAGGDPGLPPADFAFGGATVTAPNVPVPLSGGTLLAVPQADGTVTVLAADVDEDAIDVLSLGATPALVGWFPLSPGDQPGRMVADAHGRVHVVLRGAGAIATLGVTPAGVSLVMRRAVCSAPRGIDYDPAADVLYVACATGELVTLPAGADAGGEAVGSVDLGRDLRDVVVDGDYVYVTRFRSAEILTLDRSTLQLMRRDVPSIPASTAVKGTPDVAWRAVKQPTGGVRVLYQVATTVPVEVGGCAPYSQTSDGTPLLGAALGTFGPNGPTDAVALASNPIIDVATTPEGDFETLAITGAIETTQKPQPAGIGGADDGSVSGTPDEFVAIADARSGVAPAVVVQRRGAHPALLVIHVDATGKLATGSPLVLALPQRASHADTGFDIFHMPTAGHIACMNCHPEGGDDGHTWRFVINGDAMRVRRTQSLRGGVISGTAPYHWDGDLSSLQALADEIYTRRMGGSPIAPTQIGVLERFLDAIPRVPVKAHLDAARMERGRAIFDGSGDCIVCHEKATGTERFNRSVGKTDAIGAQLDLQVPMLLGVADRAPYMHDGCAATLMDRLTNPACAGTLHGVTTGLSNDDRLDLVEYLESL